MKIKYLLCSCLVIALTACGGGSGDDKENPTNSTPVANAGTNQSVKAGTVVTINGSGSSDADGDTLTFSWVLSAPAGSSASLTDATAASTTFTADIAGSYTVALTVNDGTVNSSSDSATITAQPNSVPVANAGSDQTLKVGSIVTIDGSGSSDGDSDPLTYSWVLTPPGGSSASLADATAISTTFTADVSGTYTVALTVNDGEDSSTADSATITINPNTAPVANAGADQLVTTGAVVTIDGNSSSDADSDPLTYSWVLTPPGGSSAALANASEASTTFTADISGVYTATLTVNDGEENSVADDVVITANIAPVSNAGTDQVVSASDLVNLDGSGSSDADSDPLSYTWTLTKPAGSSASLSNANIVNPSFTADVEGTYFLSLVVNDGKHSSSADEMAVSTVWLLNTTGETAAVITNADASAIEVNVQSVTMTNVSGTDYYQVNATGIPSYNHTMSSDEINTLNSRPQASTDFKSGSATTATAGNNYDFGADINFNSKEGGSLGCYANAGSGAGWFPPGPSCPTDQGFEVYFPVTPSPAVTTCYTQTNSIGLYKNGAAIFNWSDDASYNNEGNWHQLAAKFEAYDVDVCFGHATQDGTYHQHFEANCLAEQIGDDGSAGHSPVYGYAGDGYPIHGIWYSTGVKAKSCWKTRDYDNRNAGTTGCEGGSAGQRTCVLNDPYDYTQGTTAVTGPTTSTVVTSFSGNDFTVTPGFYFEDYYYDSTCTALGNENLDEHNGHDHGSYGYHYHVTDDFPYNVGPSYYGKLHSNSIGVCGATPEPAGGGGGGPPPPGG